MKKIDIDAQMAYLGGTTQCISCYTTFDTTVKTVRKGLRLVKVEYTDKQQAIDHCMANGGPYSGHRYIYI